MVACYHLLALLQLVSHMVLCLVQHCSPCSSMISRNLLHLLPLHCLRMTQQSSLLELYSVEDIAAKLNSAMSRISSWMSENGLTLNITKTKSMLIHSPSKRSPPLVVSYNDSLIDQVQVFKLLGVFVDQHLNWDNHVNHVVTTVSRNVSLMRRLSWTLPRKSLLCFYYTYVIPSLNYCSLVWRSCRKSNLQRLQCLQNLSGWIILKLPKPYSATSAINTHPFEMRKF